MTPVPIRRALIGLPWLCIAGYWYAVAWFFRLASRACKTLAIGAFRFGTRAQDRARP